MTGDPWTIYWQADHRDSCIAMASDQDGERVAALWREFARGLGESSAVLDLATGNGAVPAALLQGNPSLRVTGVDLAEIDPVTFLSAPGDLQKVSFIGGVDVCQLPFDANHFDAVTSQFGIEYADLETAVAEAVRVLRCDGKLAFLMHHAASAVVSPAKNRLREMKSLLRPGGVAEQLSALLSEPQTTAALDLAGRRHLEEDLERTAGISGQVFEGVKRVIQSLQRGDRVAASELATSMTIRLRADQARLSQLVEAALDESRFNAVVRQVEGLGLTADRATSWSVPGAPGAPVLVGWQLCCTKN